jgi:UrcA family protein
MFRSILAGGAMVATAAFVPQLPVAAQESVSPAITVSAPGVRNTGQPADGVQQRKQLVAHVAVDTHDLDLRTEYGRAVLDARIRLAAAIACDRIDEIDPPVGAGGWVSDRGDCRHLAVKSAEPDKRAAIRAAG